ncbi:AraC family transcriptional regulator [Galbibacter sp. EGI 63066]|uniref:AraC family transcriptional regulator n=1 Tax=Galbibacter sp. EGI 63066 TaxID=2993559 RepID=UPI0022487905|nr:AraC family transcriptional regulator [Galbibacter sp. EGI 63066]MCX2679139.1 AraC family transcriptional regulator [Galbibacter sp. EGI 63066]
MKKTFYIKNMVCGRCEMVVGQLFEKNNAPIEQLQLGKVTADVSSASFDEEKLATSLQEHGFELLHKKQQKTTEQIKTLLIKYIDAHEKLPENISVYLAEQLHKEYSSLSRTFKNNEGYTIEKFFIKLKIERAKELIQMDRLSFSEIAYELNYNSVSHLSGQFKRVSGITMSHFKRMQDQNRQSFDKIL